MSDQEFGRFLTSAAEDADLARAFVLAVGDRQGDDAIRAVAEFVRGHGYDVDAEDAARVRQSLIAAADNDRDLGDDELDGVDGGIVVETAIGVGLIGAAIAGTGVLGVAATAVAVGSLIPEVGAWFKQW